ncbi:MAG: G/U mismatch-specific DNA glycosylase [Anaerolineae bacterium]
MPAKPSRLELQAAANKTVPDVIVPGLRVLFCGINPGLYSAAIGHHFGRPGNRFWPALYAGGFTPRLFSPYDEVELLSLGLGIVNLVDRASLAADELSAEELVTGAQRLEAKVAQCRPSWVAVLTIGEYRRAFGRPKAQIGQQPEMIAGSHLWLLPNPSGLNAHYTPSVLGELFGAFREAVEELT